MGGLSRLRRGALRQRAIAEGVKDFKPISRAEYAALPAAVRENLERTRHMMGPGAAIYVKPDGGYSVLSAVPQSLDDFNNRSGK